MEHFLSKNLVKTRGDGHHFGINDQTWSSHINAGCFVPSLVRKILSSSDKVRLMDSCGKPEGKRQLAEKFKADGLKFCSLHLVAPFPFLLQLLLVLKDLS